VTVRYHPGWGLAFVVLGLWVTLLATRTLVVEAASGGMRRRFGGSEGQQLIVEDDRIVRVRPDGKRRRPQH
jgi:hypothetical protein